MCVCDHLTFAFICSFHLAVRPSHRRTDLSARLYGIFATFPSNTQIRYGLFDAAAAAVAATIHVIPPPETRTKWREPSTWPRWRGGGHPLHLLCSDVRAHLGRWERGHLAAGLGRPVHAAHGVLGRTWRFGFGDFVIVRMVPMTSMFGAQCLDDKCATQNFHILLKMANDV